jgi:hypothetical protein
MRPHAEFPTLWMTLVVLSGPVLAFRGRVLGDRYQSRGAHLSTGRSTAPDARRLPGVKSLCGRPHVWMVLWTTRTGQEDDLT